MWGKAPPSEARIKWQNHALMVVYDCGVNAMLVEWQVVGGLSISMWVLIPLAS